jgi:hypothetical protein
MKEEIERWLIVQELDISHKYNRIPRFNPRQYLERYVFNEIHESFFSDFTTLLQEWITQLKYTHLTNRVISMEWTEESITWLKRVNNKFTHIVDFWIDNIVLFVLFSSMCEQKVSTYMPSWALLVMTAVCKEVRKKTIELITRIKQKLKGSMSIITKMKNKRKWTNITNVLLDLIDEIQRYTKEKEDLGPFPLQWKALEALN